MTRGHPEDSLRVEMVLPSARMTAMDIMAR